MLFIVGAVVILVLVFVVGAAVGFRKASFSERFGENYQRLFVGRRGLRDLLREGNGRSFMNTHGAAGEIISIAGDSIMIKGVDGVEKDILASAGAVIRDQRRDIQISDLQVGDFIAAIGAPNEQGQIAAKLIRVIRPAADIGRPFGGKSQ